MVYKLEQEIEKEEDFLRKILKRLVHVIKFLCARGINLRVDDETFVSNNNGNYLGILELISEYEDFLKRHNIEVYANYARGNTTSYLSKTISEELISDMGEKVFAEIISIL